MRVVRTLRTRWATYAVTFSRDGTRLAFGGGSWYGHGGIVVAEVESGQCTTLDWHRIPWVAAGGIHPSGYMPCGVPSVSGLSFSDDDRFVAASMWGASHRYAPAMLFQFEGHELSPVDVCDYQGVDPFLRPSDDDRPMLGPTPTGVLLHESYIIVRQHGGDPAGRHVIVLSPLPADRHVRATLATQHLTHSRLVAIRESVITEAGGSRAVSRLQDDGSYARVPATEGLAIRSLRDPSAPPVAIPVEDCGRVTAIAALPGNRGFLTGGGDGQIDEWSWDGAWRQRRIGGVTIRPAPSPAPAIVAIVVTAAAQRVAVSVAGDLLIQQPDGEWTGERLPEWGSPRALAAHPREPWIAVGLKRGGFAEPESAVMILEVDS